MLPTIESPEVHEIRDHWTWLPDWTAHRPRLLWYLTFEETPDVRAAAAPSSEVLRASGADVVPPEWLHLTVSDVGFIDELDDGAVRACREQVRRDLRSAQSLELTLGPIGVLPDAVVLDAGPVAPLNELRSTVRRAAVHAGIEPPDDFDGERWPHVSLCYLNGGTDHARLSEAVRATDPRTFQVRCDRLAQVLVTRTDGHYRWQVLDDVPLGARRFGSRHSR